MLVITLVITSLQSYLAMIEKIRETNEITRFQSYCIASWEADINSMRNIEFNFDENADFKKKMLDDFFNRKESAPKVFRTNGRRVFNPLTCMSRKMRPFITCNGKQLIEIDTANSHPLILVYELKRNNLAVEDELIKVVENGAFYDLFKKKGRSRDMIKKDVFSFFYAVHINPDHHIYKCLNNRFPDFINSLKIFSEGKSLSELLQKIESNIWIDGVSAAAMFAGINHATIHDSIVFADDKKVLNDVLNIIFAAFGEIKPKLHVRTLDGKDVDYQYTPSKNMDPFMEKAKKYQYCFWVLNEKKGVYSFKLFKLLLYLQSIGIYRYYTTKTDYFIIQIIDNIVDVIDMPAIKHLIIHFIDEVGEPRVKDSLAFHINKLINESSLQLIEPIDINIFRGEKEAVYVFYRDVVAKVSVAGITKIAYNLFPHYIWKSSILNRNYLNLSHLDGTPGEFEIFFNNVFSDSANRTYVQQVFGYALQRYRRLSDMKAIILTDDNVDDQAKGGTGKGVVIQALTHFLPFVKENGKSFKPDVTFSYQNMTPETRLFIIDDVRQNFDITKLFSVLTDGVQIEKKFTQPYFIHPDDLPVFAITSNYGLQGSDDSHIRRRLDIGVDKHYTPKYTPSHQFGHDLFREWEIGGPEWSKFDEFMLNCAHLFITNGVGDYKNPNLLMKQFRADTHIDFEDFAEKIMLNTPISKTLTLAQLRELTNKSSLSKTTMTRWLKSFASLKNYGFQNDRRNDTFCFTST